MHYLQFKNLARSCCLVVAAILTSPELLAATTPRIAIIIDDLGYQRVAGERAVALPGPVTIAILPNTPRDSYFANLAHAAGKEVLLHLPLQSVHDEGALDTMAGSLLLDMDQRQVAQIFSNSIAAVPHAVGVNNHRGSLLTRHPGHMDWLMQEILRHGNLFFVDSFTTAESVALKIALENGLLALRRDVFLDPDSEPDTLQREFSRLKKLARQRGFAVGIGHPKPATLAFLELALPTLSRDGYALVTISDLIAAQTVSVSATDD